MNIYTIPEIIEKGLLMSKKTKKPITTRTSVTRIWVKIGGSKVGKNYILTQEEIDTWNNSIKK